MMLTLIQYQELRALHPELPPADQVAKAGVALDVDLSNPWRLSAKVTLDRLRNHPNGEPVIEDNEFVRDILTYDIPLADILRALGIAVTA